MLLFAADCSAGYLCVSGSDTPTPDGSQPQHGSPCPVGYYCLEGTLDPHVCPGGKVIVVAGASSPNNCTDCPGGYVCNGTVATPCLPGYYCPYLQDMQACPPGTYSNANQSADESTCKQCTPGYWCPDPATVQPVIPCPVGHYCPAGTGGIPSANVSVDPIPCPSGTYRDETQGTSGDDCHECNAGYYCPNATTVCFNCTDAAVTGRHSLCSGISLLLFAVLLVYW